MVIVSVPSAHVQVIWTIEFVGAFWMAAENAVTSLKSVIGPMFSSFHCMMRLFPDQPIRAPHGSCRRTLRGLGTSS